MKRDEIERLRETVACDAVLLASGFSVDRKESTPRAVKFRRGGEIIIVTHAGRGWFDPLSDDKGDIFRLAAHLHQVGFVECCAHVANLVGFRPSAPEWKDPPTLLETQPSAAARWAARRQPWVASATWRYLRWNRMLPACVIRAAIMQDILREGPRGTMWALHTGDMGEVTGWEERSAQWRGFATGGHKILFRFGEADAFRICVAEAAIDAMSLAALEGIRAGTLYVSTGGGWSPGTEAALRTLAARSRVEMVAATDANSQGDAYADRLRCLSENVGCAWRRLRPPADDWNEVLKQRVR